MSSNERSRVPKGTARRRMLAAGIELMLSDPPDPVMALTVKDITAAAGVSEGAFYTHWPTSVDEDVKPIDRYVRDLMAFIAAHPLDRGPRETTATVERQLAEDQPLAAAIRDGSWTDVERLADKPAWRVQLLLSAARPDQEDVRRAWEGTSEAVSEVFRDLYANLLVATGRKLRPPLTIDDFVVLLASMSEGLSLRLMAGGSQRTFPEPDDDQHPWNLLGLAIMAMLPMVTVPVDEEDPADLRMHARELMPALGRGLG